MFRKKLNVMVCVFMLGILISINAAVAYAATAYGNWGYYGPVNGYSYQNQSSINNDYAQLSTTTLVQNQASGNIPAGYMGVKTQLYNSNNQLVDYSDWITTELQ